MMDTSYEDDIKINEYKLDWEWGRHASLMMKWSKKHALAVTRKAQAEQNLRIVRSDAKWIIDKEKADIDKDIREYPEDYGFEKTPSDKAVEHAINRDKGLRKLILEQNKLIKQATDELIEATEEEGVYAAAEKAMVHRKKSLENLGALYLANYYGEPRQPGSTRKRYEQAKEVGKEFRRGMNEGRRRDDD